MTTITAPAPSAPAATDSFLAPTHGPGLALSISREALLVAVQAVEPVTGANARPVYQNLCLSVAEDGSFTVIGTDGTIGVRSAGKGATVREAGSITLAARAFAAILASSASAQVDLEQVMGEAASLRITLSDGDFTLPLSTDALPPIDASIDPAMAVTLAGPALAAAIERTVWAADRERTSAVLSGLRLAREGRNIVFAATDGKVLVETSIPYTGSPTGPEQVVIVPRETVAFVARLCHRISAATVDVASNDSTITFRCVTPGVSISVTSRQINGAYPAYRMAFASACKDTLTIQRAAWIDGIRRACVVSAKTPVVATADAQGVVLSPLNVASGYARIRVPGTLVGREQTRFGVNPDYLTAILEVLAGESVTVELGRGVVMRQDGLICLVMPIALPQ